MTNDRYRLVCPTAAISLGLLCATIVQANDACCLVGYALAQPVLETENAGDQEVEPAAAARFDPVEIEIEGWTVHVDPALLDGEHSEEGRDALEMLGNHLQRIRILMPGDTLADLRKVGIWIEHEHPELKNMQYHPGREWLVEHGYDPRLTRMVHIPVARQLLSGEQLLKHPAVVLHELAHGFHDQYLGFDDEEVIEVFRLAQEAGIYEDVLLYTGESVRHYGLTNQMEYFAEGTESFFYRNDFYPFVRAELREHDPALHDLLQKIWIDRNYADEGTAE